MSVLFFRRLYARKTLYLSYVFAMNTLGRLFRLQLYGESHGQTLGVLIEGCPAGLSISTSDFSYDLARRKPSGQASTTRKEADRPQLLSGLQKGRTTGAPLLISFANTDVRSSDYSQVAQQPRPGHADWVAQQKYGEYADLRGGGHFSGRMTLPLVAAGVVAKKLLPEAARPVASIEEVAAETEIEKGIARALEAKDSVGGVVACRCEKLPAGLGEPFFDTIEGLLARAIFAIPAVKGVAFGNGFEATRLFGSENNDSFLDETGRTATNHAGGVSGGLSNGNPLCFHIAVKPTSSTPAVQRTFDRRVGALRPLSVKGRHDLCIALRVPVVVEALTACVLVDLYLQAQKIPRILPS